MRSSGDVKISNPVIFPMPTSSSRRPTYLTKPSPFLSSGLTASSRSSYSRAASLDRSSMTTTSSREPTSYYRYEQSSSSSSKYGAGLVGARRSSALPFSLETSRATDSVDLLARISSFQHHSSNVSPLKSFGSRRSSDAIHDCSTNAVLMNIRHLSIDGGSPLHHRLSTQRANARLPPTGSRLSHQPVSCASSSGGNLHRTESDENSNGGGGGSGSSLSPYRTRFDSNHNVMTKNANDDKNNSPTSSHVPRYRHDSTTTTPAPGGGGSGGSPEENSYSPHRTRHGSSYTATTSGYSSDNGSTSSFGNRRSTSRDGMDKGGLVGLRNLGNTCFMNSVIQCLSNTRPLLDYCLKESYVSECNVTVSSMKGALIKAFASLLHSIWKGNSDSAINPQLFKNQIQKFAPRFMGYNQQDAQEFLRYLLQGLHEDVNRITTKPKPIITDIDETLGDNQKAAEAWRRYVRIDDSKIVDIFVGQLKSTLQCTTCGHCSVTFDPFWDLSLPIPKAAGQVKLQQCFDLFTKEEILDGDEKPTCAKCKTRRRCTKSMTIHKFPRILVIHLKRFSPMERYRSKLSTHVEFPITRLDLSSYASSTSKSQSCIYNLYAVSNHSGTIYSGHYTAYCKHPHSGEWHDFNDSRVSSMSSSSLVSSEAYVLFYEMSNNSSLV